MSFKPEESRKRLTNTKKKDKNETDDSDVSKPRVADFVCDMVTLYFEHTKHEKGELGLRLWNLFQAFVQKRYCDYPEHYQNIVMAYIITQENVTKSDVRAVAAMFFMGYCNHPVHFLLGYGRAIARCLPKKHLDYFRYRMSDKRKNKKMKQTLYPLKKKPPITASYNKDVNEIFHSEITDQPKPKILPKPETPPTPDSPPIIPDDDGYDKFIEGRLDLPEMRNEDDLRQAFNEYKKGLLVDISYEEFRANLFHVVMQPITTVKLQSQVFDLVGFDMRFVAYLLKNRKKIRSLVEATGARPKLKSQQTLKAAKKSSTTTSVSSVKSFHTASTSSVDKQVLTLPKISTNTQAVYNHVHDENQAKTSRVMLTSGLVKLPESAVKKSTKEYDVIHIPAREVEPLDESSLVQISHLDLLGKLVFRDIKQFNRIQSEVFPVANLTNQNMLICAPTGAGKTNIALMTMVHQIRSHIEGGVLRLNKFKIVYICPMKALAAEMVRNFQAKLAPLGIIVREVTGDMQLTRKEMNETQVLVATPEKWDVITRKGQTDTDVTDVLKLLIIDEVHLLNSDRGPVLECLVARTLRLVMSQQSMIRIVGLSATLPNYLDVARFLRVDVANCLFYFDDRYRSVPLSQTFIGVRAVKPQEIARQQDEVCFLKTVDLLKEGHQVMIFVHARNQTYKFGRSLKEMAGAAGLADHFQPQKKRSIKTKKGTKSSNSQLEELMAFGIGTHHAGMSRTDRNVVELAFLSGTIKVLCCTATLAWGVNLPAHGVIIRGTTLYDSKKCSFVDLDILDVLQIFGRAGRPQFDRSGSGIIITTHDKLNHYLKCLTNQVPIESQFLKALPDNLNAEVVLGTVSNVQEAVEWLTYTYMYHRIRINPNNYGLSFRDIQDDPDLRKLLLSFIHQTAKVLDKSRMIRYNADTGDIIATNLGRTASYYYINFDTINVINNLLCYNITEAEIFNIMCMAAEFHQIQVRQEEMEDLDNLYQYCHFNVPGGPEHSHGKANILMQTYVSRGLVKSMSLASDMEYVVQNCVRLARALFDIALHDNNAWLSRQTLLVAKMFELRMWPFQHAMYQYADLSDDIKNALQNCGIAMADLRQMTEPALGCLVRNFKLGWKVKMYLQAFPSLEIESSMQPITRSVIRVKLLVTPKFKWVKSIHGKMPEMFWLWVEDSNKDVIHYSESFVVTKKACDHKDTIELVFTIPYNIEMDTHFLTVRIESNRWMHCSFTHALYTSRLVLPPSSTPSTNLLTLEPLAISVLQNPKYEELYNFTHFNPIQTQIFHTLYHTNNNILLGAPTGSGKTIVAEICMFRLFNLNPELKVVYIAPLKALVRERSNDWKARFGKNLKKNVIEITGDVTPSLHKIKAANVIITTPEKWDGMSRGWQNRDYIRDVGLLIIDEIHLLGEDRGPVIEVIVSRTNFIKNRTKRKIRIVGLSTAIANSKDLATWLGIDKTGLYNFRPTVRPVPILVHISGFPGKHYCPRMISMNRPAYQAIRQHAPDSPVLVFCSSRKQTRLTASGLITYLLTDHDPKQWLKCEQEEIERTIYQVQDNDLRYFLSFGIGIHHAGLRETDRQIVEELFVHFKIQVLISTATLAWGVNFPAHLVIVKGTEYFDGRLKRYVDMPITDILQMIGRAGRPQYDTQAVACVFVHDVKKNFYKRFLYEPFPVESNLLAVLPDHVNAEVAVGTITMKVQLMEYLTWTYFYRRLMVNPSYYGLENCKKKKMTKYLDALAESATSTLEEHSCITVINREESVYYESTFLGHVASFYYISYKTVFHYDTSIRRDSSLLQLLHIMAFSEEFSQFPVRHNEDLINTISENIFLKAENRYYAVTNIFCGKYRKQHKLISSDLAKELKYITKEPMDSPYIKVIILLMCHFQDVKFPNPEYHVDLKIVFDSVFRLIQGMLDITVNKNWLCTSLKITNLCQMIVQGRWLNEPDLLTLPHMDEISIKNLYETLNEPFNLGRIKKMSVEDDDLTSEVLMLSLFDERQVREVMTVLRNLPILTVDVMVTQGGSRKKRFMSGRNVEITVDLKRNGGSLNVISGKFPKQKDESWLLFLGFPANDELVAMKRFTAKAHTIMNFSVAMPDVKGRVKMALYVLSDSYIGLDEVIHFDVELM